MRRAAHEGFNIRASTAYQPLQEKESALLASHMLRNPMRWEEHLKRSAASTVLTAVYGWLPIDTSADTLVTRINALAERIVHACAPGAYFVEIFPSMLYLPEWLAKWKREGRAWFRKDTNMFEGFFDEVAMKMVSYNPVYGTSPRLCYDRKQARRNPVLCQLLSKAIKNSTWISRKRFG